MPRPNKNACPKCGHVPFEPRGYDRKSGMYLRSCNVESGGCGFKETPQFAKRYISSVDGNCGKHFQRITDSCTGKPENGKWPEQCLSCGRFVP